VVFCQQRDSAAVRGGLLEHYYAGLDGFDESRHLIDAVPSAGALHLKTK
jgi:hypothetical protein